MIATTNVPIESTIKILGLFFDTKLKWDAQTQYAIEKAMKMKQGIGLVSRFFSSNELKLLATSLFYSQLYYGSGVWMLENMRKHQLKKLDRASSSMLKIVQKDSVKLSFQELHAHFKQPTPTMIKDYSVAVTLLIL
jgi:uncharacterized HAD superfamily protein